MDGGYPYEESSTAKAEEDAGQVETNVFAADLALAR
jgi:hypothetical protein